MSKIVVSGGRRLSGTVSVSGAKNSALKTMAAAILTDQPVIINNVPDIKDVSVMSEVLKELGMTVNRSGKTVTLQAKDKLDIEAPYELVRKMRASIVVLGPLLARFGRARVAMPGGCNIGLRKIDLHIRSLELLGAKIDVDHASIEASADFLRGADIYLDYPSVGATENIMMAATLARGTTVIENAAREPEIVDLADCLNKMGAAVDGAGTTTIVIDGVEALGGAQIDVIPDRIEASTFLAAAAVTGGSITVKSVMPEHLAAVLNKLARVGCRIETGNDHISLQAPDSLGSVNISTLPYPGFPTDMQAPFMSLLSLADKTSVVTENVFENRFSFIHELNKLGGQITVTNHHAIITGRRVFKTGSVAAPDLRAGAGLVLAGLAADGEVEISAIHHIERGYEDFVGRLKSLGAEIALTEDKSVYELSVNEGGYLPDISGAGAAG